MADLSDVLNVLVSQVDAIVNPNGDSQPSILGSSNNIAVFPGWPEPETLAADIKAGTCSVSVYPRPEERNTTRYPTDWQTVSANTATLTLTPIGQTVTVGGTVPNPISGNPHNMAVFVNYVPYVYGVQQGDTLNSIASALAALINAVVPGTSATGAVITLPTGARLGPCRVGVTAVGAQELRRQERVFQVTVWADTPAHRDAIAAPIDQAIAAITFLTLPDQFAARIRYHSSPMTDMLEKDGIYRRDLLYSVDYSTTESQVVAEVVATKVNITPNVSGVAGTAPAITVYE
jgi:hypothetical protein